MFCAIYCHHQLPWKKKPKGIIHCQVSLLSQFRVVQIVLSYVTLILIDDYLNQVNELQYSKSSLCGAYAFLKTLPEIEIIVYQTHYNKL